MIDLNWGSSRVIYFLVAIIISFLLSLFLYDFLRRKKTVFSRFPIKVKWLLLSIRWGSFVLFLLLVLGPVLQYVRETLFPPKCAILIDNSRSIAYQGYTIDQLKHSYLSFVESLEARGYDVESFVFDSDLFPIDSLGFDGDQSNLNKGLEKLSLRSELANVKEVVVYTDGQFNSGHKTHTSNALGFNTSFIALGDTGMRSDVVLRSFYVNDEVYKGDRFQIKAGVFAQQLAGKMINVKLMLADSVIQEKAFKVLRAQQFFEWELGQKSDSTGVLQYKVVASAVNSEEATTQNNVLSRMVRVKEKKRRVLLVYEKMHPDIFAFKSLFSNDKAYHFQTIHFGEQVDFDWSGVDVIVQFGQSSAKKVLEDWRQTLSANSIPKIVFAQGVAGSSAGSAVAFSMSTGTEVGMGISDQFNLFSIDSLKDVGLNRLPPLLASSMIDHVPPSDVVLAQQRISGVGTNRPLIVLKEKDGVREAFFLAENWWKWRLWEQVQEEVTSLSPYSYLMNGVFRYVLASGRTDLLDLQVVEKAGVDEPIRLNAKLYDLSQTQSTAGKVSATLFKGGEVVFKHDFSLVNKGYVLTIPGMSEGVYTLKCKAVLGNRLVEKTSLIAVEARDYEAMELGADVSELKALAEDLGGVQVYFGQEAKLFDHLQNRQYQPKVFFNYISEELIHFRVIFWLLIVFLLSEWFLRKLYGSV